MKSWNDMTPEEQQEEADTIVFFDATEIELSSDLGIRQEVVLLLSPYPHLLGFYNTLRFLYQQKILLGQKQGDLAEFLQMSRPTFTKYRDDLIKLKLIRLEPSPGTWKQKNIKFNYISHISEVDMRRRFKLKSNKEILEWIIEMRSKIKPVTPEELDQLAKEEDALKSRQQSELFIEQQSQVKAKEIVRKKEEAKKKDEERFPSQDYQSIIDGYIRNKGVSVHGPDAGRVRKAAKQMFLSGHTVLEIISCMQFFKEYSRKEGYEWMVHWTIETVMKKMPEFKAGQLKRPDMADGMERI